MIGNCFAKCVHCPKVQTNTKMLVHFHENLQIDVQTWRTVWKNCFKSHMRWGRAKMSAPVTWPHHPPWVPGGRSLLSSHRIPTCFRSLESWVLTFATWIKKASCCRSHFSNWWRAPGQWRRVKTSLPISISLIRLGWKGGGDIKGLYGFLLDLFFLLLPIHHACH